MDGIQTCGQLLEGGLTRRNIDRLTRVDGLTGIRQLQSASDCRLDRIHAALAVAPADAVLHAWAATVTHTVPNDFVDGTGFGKPLMRVQFSVAANVVALLQRCFRFI